MADTEATSEATSVSSPVAAKKTPVTKSKAKPEVRTSTAEMVSEAIANLHERDGSSLQAIKKYIASTYLTDADRLAPYIRNHLKKAVASGALIQTKGQGAVGSFKLPTAKTSQTVTRSVIAKKAGTAKKRSSGKKTTKAAAKKSAATTSKSPSKAKKVSKAPTTKPKAPKPKKIAAKSSARQAAAKK